ncbi:MAG: bifunctional glycosyltransferase family 2/GtrA family protein [Candidatus Paceibacterota bacterium]
MISIIIPAYNEEKRLPKTLAAVFAFLDNEKIEAEVIVVNDGSRDGTKKIADDIAAVRKNLKVISYAENKGKGGAVKTGVMAATGEFVIFLDADNSTSMSGIKQIKDLINQGCDVVIGSRKIKGAKILKQQPFLRRILGSGFNLFVKIILGLSDYSDTQCGFKGFRREVARNIFAKAKITGFAFDTELLCIAGNFNYKIKEMPIFWQDEKQSTLRLKSVWNIFLDVWKIKYNLLRGEYGAPKIFNKEFVRDLLIAVILSEIAGFIVVFILRGLFPIIYSEPLIFLLLPLSVGLVMFLAKISSKRIYEFTKFLIVGGLNTAIDFGVLNILSVSFNIFSGSMIILFNIISFFAAVANSYFFNKFWTFKKQGNPAMPELFSFLAVSVAVSAINTIMVYLGTTFFKHIGSDYFWLNFVKSIAFIVSILLNFIGYKFFVFKKIRKD